MAIPRDPGPRGPHSNLPTVKGGNKGHRGGKGKGPKGGKGGKGKGPKFVPGSGYGGYHGVNAHQLNQLVHAQLQALIDPLKDQRQDVRQQSVRDLAQEDRLYSRTKGDLDHIFGTTNSYIKGTNEETAKAWERARGTVAGTQGSLMGQLGANAQGTIGDAQGELARLGIGAAGTALSGNVADSQFAQGMASQQGANNSANLEAMAAAAGSIGNLLLGQNQGSYMASSSQAATNHQETVQGIKDDRRDALQEIMDAINDARGTRPGLFAQLLQQLQTTGWGMYVDQRNLNQQQQQINMQRQAQRFAQNQSRRSSRGGSSSGGSGSSSGSSGSSSSPGGYYGTNNDLLIDALTGKPPKGKGKGRK